MCAGSPRAGRELPAEPDATWVRPGKSAGVAGPAVNRTSRSRTAEWHTGAMAEPKTVPTDADVDEFLDAATPARRREDGLRLAELFSDVTGVEPVMWGPSMVGYGMYRFVSPANPRTRGVWPKTGFSPRKAQLTLYGLKDLPDGAALLPALGTYIEGAGCIYVKKLDDIDLEVLRRLIAIAWSRADDPDAAPAQAVRRE